MDKIKQAIEQARAERVAPSPMVDKGRVHAGPNAERTAAIPFVPSAAGLANAKILPINDSGAAARALRLLRTIVVQKAREHGWSTVGVVAGHHADAKSILAGNLAVALAADPRCSAVLVDLDVEHPWVGDAFGVPDNPGLAACLRGDASLSDVVYAPANSGRLEVATLCRADETVDGAHLALETLPAVLAGLKAQPNSIVVVDLPAVLDNDAALTASMACDCLLYVVREGVTARAELERGLGLLSAVPVLGTVVVDSLTAPTADATGT